MRFFFICFFIFNIHFSAFCTSIDSTKAIIYTRKAKQFHEKPVHDSAIYYFTQIRAYYKEQNNFPSYWNAAYHLGINYKSTSAFKKSIYYLEEALTISKKKLDKEEPYLGLTFKELSSVYARMGDFQKELYYARKSLTELLRVKGKYHAHTASAYTAMAWAYGRFGLHHKELEYYQKRLEVNKKLHGENHIEVARSYVFVGYCYGKMGNVQKKLQYCQKALAITLKHPNQTSSKVVSQCYFLIGIAFLENDQYQNAIQYLVKSLEIDKKCYEKDSEYIGIDLVYLGYAYLKIESFEQSLQNLNLGLKIIRNVLGEAHIHTARAYDYLSEYYQTNNDTIKALNYMQKALKIRTQKYGEKNIITAESHHKIATFYLNQKAYQKALKAAHHCILSLSSSFDDVNIHKNPSPNEEVANKTLYIKALQAKAIAVQHIPKGKKLNHLNKAWEIYLLAIQWINKARIEYSSEEAKYNLYAMSHKIFEESISLAYKLYQTKKDSKYIKKAFQIAEQSKAIILIEALQDHQAKKVSAIPEEQIENESKIKNNIVYYQKLLFDAQVKQNNKSILLYKNKLFSQRQKLDSVIEYFEKKFPSYHKVKYDFNVASIKTIQNHLLKGNTSLIEYFWGENNIFTFIISPKKVKIIQTPIKKSYYTDINLFIKNLRTTKHQDPKRTFLEYTRLASSLYISMCKKALKEVNTTSNKIILIPDGPLCLIPFETLLSSTNHHSTIKYSKLSYLLKKYTFSYGYSSTHLLYNLNNKPNSNIKHQCIAFAPNFEDKPNQTSQGNMLNPLNTSLPGAQQEIAHIANHFSGDFHFAHEANEKNFKAYSSLYAIIHLALHGKDNPQAPLFSFLSFGKSLNGTEDNKLYAYELYTLNLNAQMVVLSACETGSGKYVKGEGVISLAHGFLLAGSASVVSTLWSIPDQSSAQIMEYFYKGLANHLDKDQALQNAKINYLEASPMHQSHPAFWAGFIISGNNEPIHFDKNRNSNILTYTILSLAIFFFFYLSLIFIKKR